MSKAITLAVVLALVAGSTLAAPVAPTGQVNINTASVQELQLLPRVGPALAKRIVDFRATNGLFKAPEELARVKGIGEKSFARLQPLVSVSGTTTLKEKVKSPRTSTAKKQS